MLKWLQIEETINLYTITAQRTMDCHFSDDHLSHYTTACSYLDAVLASRAVSFQILEPVSKLLLLLSGQNVLLYEGVLVGQMSKLIDSHRQ